MLIRVPAATIAVLFGSARPTAAETKDTARAILISKFARDVESAYKSDPMGRRQQLQKKRSLKKKERNTNSNATTENEVDVGILAAGASSATQKIYPLFLHGQQKMGKEERQRFLQDEEAQKICAPGCPQEFCDCGFENKEVKYCTKEMLSVCERGIVSRCVRDDYLAFYEETYCPFSECVENNEPYENCSCEYYADYCTLYYDLEDAFDKCVTAECCEKTPAEEKATCIPALQPTGNPTGTPTQSSPPTVTPTGTAKPTVSSMPTISSKPTSSPSISSSPTISSEPTPFASESPSSSPSISSKPTASPTDDPSPSPSQSPTYSPTVSPTDKPSARPSHAPSSSPTVSAAPTISVKPSSGPTVSNAPTVSAQPTASPSISTAPTSSPSASPSISAEPTSSPSTPVPTKPPTPKPTMEPSEKPTSDPTDSPTDVLLSVGASHSSSVLVSLCVGGVAMWLFG